MVEKVNFTLICFILKNAKYFYFHKKIMVTMYEFSGQSLTFIHAFKTMDFVLGASKSRSIKFKVKTATCWL